MSWWLSFRAVTTPSFAALEDALASVAGARPVTQRGDSGGNPRDGYSRSLLVTTVRSDGSVALRLCLAQQSLDVDRFAPVGTGSLHIELVAPSLATSERLAAWSSLRDALAPLGYEDTTLAGSPAPIVDEVEASGDHALAASMRRDITLALVRAVPTYRHVALGDTRPDDLGAVLRAYLRPEDIVSVSFTRLGLRALPAELASFPRLRSLSLHDERLTAAALRGWTFPSLSELGLLRTDTRVLEPDDLRGLPSLGTLFLASSPLERLDLQLLDVCPALRRVNLADTPLAKDRAQLGELRSRWPAVRFEGVG